MNEDAHERSLRDIKELPVLLFQELCDGFALFVGVEVAPIVNLYRKRNVLLYKLQRFAVGSEIEGRAQVVLHCDHGVDSGLKRLLLKWKSQPPRGNVVISG